MKRVQFPCLAFTQRTPIITRVTQKPIKDIGDTVELTCSVLYAREFSILWVKVLPNDITVISNGYAMVIKDTRFSMDPNTDRDTYALKVQQPITATPADRNYSRN